MDVYPRLANFENVRWVLLKLRSYDPGWIPRTLEVNDCESSYLVKLVLEEDLEDAESEWDLNLKPGKDGSEAYQNTAQLKASNGSAGFWFASKEGFKF